MESNKIIILLFIFSNWGILCILSIIYFEKYIIVVVIGIFIWIICRFIKSIIFLDILGIISQGFFIYFIVKKELLLSFELFSITVIIIYSKLDDDTIVNLSTWSENQFEILSNRSENQFEILSNQIQSLKSILINSSSVDESEQPYVELSSVEVVN